MTQAQVLAEVWRGDILECQHRGHAVIVDETGVIIDGWGDVDQIILPRSACKIFQAIPLVSSGAAKAFNLTPRQLALAGASHNGEDCHVTAVTRWLSDIGLSESDLRCGAHRPTLQESADNLVVSRKKPDQRHNNCSGKHSGFLTLAKHLNAGPEYLQIDHPVQTAIKEAIESICDAPTHGYVIDGCSAPNFALRLKDLAYGMARLAKGWGLGKSQSDAADALKNGTLAHPEMVAGTGRACTEIMQALGGKAIVKTGAEGVFTAILPEKRLGVALKIEDGATRASECAMAALLVRLGVANANDPMIRKRTHAVIKNANSWEVGGMKPAEELLKA